MVIVFLKVCLTAVPGIALATLATTALHHRHVSRGKMRRAKRSKLIYFGAVSTGLLGVVFIQFGTDTDFTSGWGIGHGALLVVSFIAFLITVSTYWSLFLVAEKEPLQPVTPKSDLAPDRSPLQR